MDFSHKFYPSKFRYSFPISSYFNQNLLKQKFFLPPLFVLVNLQQGGVWRFYSARPNCEGEVVAGLRTASTRTWSRWMPLPFVVTQFLRCWWVGDVEVELFQQEDAGSGLRRQRNYCVLHSNWMGSSKFSTRRFSPPALFLIDASVHLPNPFHILTFQGYQTMKFLWTLALVVLAVWAAEVEEEDHVLVLTAVSPQHSLMIIPFLFVGQLQRCR